MARIECCPQLDAMDCGPASLKMIAAYYGKEYSIQTLRDYCHITREGVSMQGISEAAERVNGGSVFIFELKDLEVIEISYTFANRNKTHEYAKEYEKEKQNGHLSSDAREGIKNLSLRFIVHFIGTETFCVVLLTTLFGEFTESLYFCITIYRIMKKTFVHWGGLFVVLMAFSSCFCPIVEFANQDCISITKQPSYVKEMETELCYFGSYKKEWFTYQFIATDSMMSVDRNQVQVFYQGNPLKFKLYRLSEDGWKETDAIEIKDSTLLKISIKDRLKEGESLQIVEKGLSVAGDSIVTSIRIPIIYNQTQRHVNKSSKLYQTFRPFKTWYF